MDRLFYSIWDLNKKITNMENFGNCLIECKITSLNNFLIIDDKLSKIIYGKDNSILNQLKLIYGLNKTNKNFQNILNNKRVCNMLNIKTIDDFINFIFKNRDSNDFKIHYFQNFFDIRKIKGCIINKAKRFKTLVACYDENIIHPLRYSLDDGKTWTNIMNTTIYNRMKNK